MRLPMVGSWLRKVIPFDYRVPPESLFPDNAKDRSAPGAALLFIKHGPKVGEELDDTRAANYLAAMALPEGVASLVSEYSLADAADANFILARHCQSVGGLCEEGTSETTSDDSPGVTPTREADHKGYRGSSRRLQP